MMQQVPLNVIGSSTFARYPKINDARTYNMFISDNALVPFNGSRKVATLNGNVGRGLFSSIPYKHLIAVEDNKVYSIDKSLAVNTIGQIDTFSGDVYIAENNADEIAITDGKQIYSFKFTDSTFEKVDVDFLPGYIDFQNTYFIAADQRTNQWRLSDNNDGRNWPATASRVGAIQTKPDLCRATVNFKSRLFVFGENVTEIWVNLPGRSLFPYVKQTSTIIDYGCTNPATIAADFGLLVWIGINNKATPTLLASNGGVPQEISTDGWNYVFQNLTNPANAFGFLYEQDGHVFYQASFPTDNLTVTYDFKTNQFYHRSDYQLNYQPARYVANLDRRTFFISAVDGDLYEISPLYDDYDGKTIPRVRICDHIRLPTSNNFVLDQIGMTVEQGESANVQQIDLSLSKDGGATYGNVITKTLNSVGNRKNRLRYWNLGGGNDITPQFRFWGQSRFVVTDAFAGIRA